ncbi:LysR family transcriptional regulator [Caulobacter segnis]
MDLVDVGVFVEAARVGSLAAAARRLGIAPMAASRRLAALEQEVGARLVHRTTRALSLTAEGEAFLPHAQAMLEDQTAALAAIRPSSAGASGILRVTASAPFGRKMVAPMIPAFMRANPDLQVDLQVTDAITDIVASGIDVAIRIAVLRDNSLIARRLDANPRKLYASPAYVAEHGAPKILADLADHQCLAITGVSHWTFMVGDKPVQQRVAGRFTASGVETVHMACLGGLGITMLSDWNIREDVAAGRLVEIPLADAVLESWSIWAVYPSARLVPAKTRLFIDALAAHLKA